MLLFSKFSNEFKRNHIYLRSAALTYTTLFTIVPLSIITFIIFSKLPFGETLDQNLEQFVSQNFVPLSSTQINQHINQFSQQAKSLTYAGTAVLIITVLFLLRLIETTFNEIWQVKDKRSRAKRLATYLTITFLGPLSLALSISFQSFLFSFDLKQQWSNFLQIDIELFKVLPWLFSSLSISLIYIFVPNTKVPVLYGFLGGAIAAGVFEVARMLFGLFVQNFSSYNLIYGAFAFVPIFLMWIHLSWIIILTGLLMVKILYQK